MGIFVVGDVVLVLGGGVGVESLWLVVAVVAVVVVAFRGGVVWCLFVVLVFLECVV